MNKIEVLAKAILKIKNWHTYLADYLKLKNGEIIYALRDGSKYTVRGRSNDRNIFNEVVIREFYTPKGFKIEKGDVVMDIGAHIGIFSIFASKIASKVYSFEPVPENFGLLQKNKKINRSYNITAINKAVSCKTEKKDLFFDKYNCGGHSFYSDIGRIKNKKITVETIALEDFWRQNNISRLDFLKIDCEGGEYEILFNCPRDILGKIKKISMEYHNIDEKYNLNFIKIFLEENNFRVDISVPNNILHAQR